MIKPLDLNEWLSNVVIHAPTYIGDFAKELQELVDQEHFIYGYHALCDDIDLLTDYKFEADYSKAIHFFEEQMNKLEDAEERIKKLEAELELWQESLEAGNVEFDL